jgi:hypothetical protein
MTKKNNGKKDGKMMNEKKINLKKKSGVLSRALLR